jgi:hypothetical protein
MSSRLSRLSLLFPALASCFALTACSNPVTPSVSAADRTTLAIISRSSDLKQWPVPHPDGIFGHEDPAYPPEAWQCPRGYDVYYNGWNFICDDPADTDREMPRPEGYPDDWTP